jgi:hypothetical protein
MTLPDKKKLFDFVIQEWLRCGLAVNDAEREALAELIERQRILVCHLIMAPYREQLLPR